MLNVTPLSGVISHFLFLGSFLKLEASRRGQEVSQPRHTRAGRSEKCVTLQDRGGTGMCVITAFFARVLRISLGRPCTGFLLISQEVRAVCKTRNQLSDKLSELSLLS